MYGISAVDIALWDIAGKRAGQPLCNLLGGPSAPDVEVYASFVRYGTEATVAAAVERAIGQGYRWIKLHDIAVPVIRAACEAAAGKAGVMLDVNCPWSVEQALAIDAEIADLGLHWFEEPVWPPENYRGPCRGARHRRGTASPRARTPAACSTSSPCTTPAPSTSPSPT